MCLRPKFWRSFLSWQAPLSQKLQKIIAHYSSLYTSILVADIKNQKENLKALPWPLISQEDWRVGQLGREISSCPWQVQQSSATMSSLKGTVKR
jgi:hypothetical protein